ncbi:MAG TPA: ribonuclease H-like domain-containing protein [Thermoplasmata archaeon]|nr:ribonuclease H-like domain-containing protein [Thermoplasmata archaeon]
MLRATFQHLPGIGPATEVDLWQSGFRDWSDLLARPSGLGVSPATRAGLERELARSEQALTERDAGWFTRRLPHREHWRLYPAFARETAYLDIETTGLSPYGGIVTVVTVHGGGATRSFVAGDDLEELPAYLGRYQVLVTFNGSRFDVPFLLASFPQMLVPPAHIDLRFLLYRLGHAGGLKRIEQRLGIGDRSGVEGIDGLEAVRLWQEYRRGSASALDRLVRYNRADTVNLEPLLRFATTELERRLFPSATALGSGVRPPSPSTDAAPAATRT